MNDELFSDYSRGRQKILIQISGRVLSLETDARFVFDLDKEWGSMPPDK